MLAVLPCPAPGWEAGGREATSDQRESKQDPALRQRLFLPQCSARPWLPEMISLPPTCRQLSWMPFERAIGKRGRRESVSLHHKARQEMLWTTQAELEEPPGPGPGPAQPHPEPSSCRRAGHAAAGMHNRLSQVPSCPFPRGCEEPRSPPRRPRRLSSLSGRIRCNGNQVLS